MIAEGRRFDTGKLVIYLLVSLFASLSLFPFYWSALLATQDTRSIMGMSLRFGSHLLENYRGLEQQVPFTRSLLNTLYVTAMATLTSVLVSAAAGYAFSVYQFKGKKVLFTTLMLTMMVPSVVNLVPYFFVIFLVRQYVSSSLPSEILDSARMDGLNELQIFLRIGLPLMRPALLTVAIVVVVDTWNNFMLPLVALQSPDKQILQLVLRSLSGATATPWNLVMTGSFLAIVPLLIAFIFSSKQMMESLTRGAVKG